MRAAAAVTRQALRETPAWVWRWAFPFGLAVAAGFLAVHPITDPDFWYHSAFARVALQHSEIPRYDVFSHTALGHRWISSGWLSSIALHFAFEAFGSAGPVALVWMCVTAAATATYYVAARNYHTPLCAAALVLVGMLASYPRFNPRPDVVSQLAIVPLVLLLASTESLAILPTPKLPRRLWLLPPFFILWANLHALFFLGLVIVALYALWRLILWRRSGARVHVQALAPCCVCAVIWLLNPYGWRLLQFVYDNATLPKIGDRVYELKPLLDAETLHGGILLHILAAIAMLLGAGGLCYWTARREIPMWRSAALALLVFLLFCQRRQIGLVGAAIPALLAPNLLVAERVLNSRRILGWAVGVAGIGGICAMRLGGVLDLPRGMPKTGIDCEWFPCGAAKFLRANPAPPNLFNDLYTGGYLLHELGPAQKVFIDGRLEIYKDGPWQDYFGPPEHRMSSDQLFAQYNVQTAVLDIRGTHNNPGHLANQLARRPDWLPVYFDDQYMVLVHETSSTQTYIQQHGFRYANPLDWSRLSGAAGEEKSRAAAMMEAKRALQLAPHSAAANTALALAHYNFGNQAEGDEYLRAAQQIDPTIQLATN